jgi:hypothetical protein
MLLLFLTVGTNMACHLMCYAFMPKDFAGIFGKEI